MVQFPHTDAKKRKKKVTNGYICNEWDFNKLCAFWFTNK